jgi:hypothetical protein
LTVIVLVLVAGCGGGGGAGKTLALLPSDTSFVAGIDLVKLRGSALWSEGERLVKGLAKDGGTARPELDGLAAKLKEAKKTARIGPEDVSAVAFGASIDDHGSAWAVLVTADDPSEKGLVKLLFAEAEVDRDEVGGLTVWTLAAKGVPDRWRMALCMIDAHTFAYGVADYVEEIAELHAGGKAKKSAADNEKLVAAVKRADAGAAAWAAFAMNDTIEEELARAPVKHLDDATGAAASLALAKGVALGVRIAFAKMEDAKDAAEALDAAARDAKKSARDLKERVPWLKTVFEALKIEAVGAEAVATLALTDDDVTAIAKWARKDPAAALSFLGGRGFGDGGIATVGGECSALLACFADAKIWAADDMRALESEVTRAVDARDELVCGSTAKGIASLLETRLLTVPTSCGGPGSGKPPPPPPDPPRPISALGGDCRAYVDCMRGLARAYRASSMAGREDIAKAMEDGASTMEKSMTDYPGSTWDATCKSGMSALRDMSKSMDSIPDFVFPDECR